VVKRVCGMGITAESTAHKAAKRTDDANYGRSTISAWLVGCLTLPAPALQLALQHSASVIDHQAHACLQH
jgi:hypothetical protein